MLIAPRSLQDELKQTRPFHSTAEEALVALMRTASLVRRAIAQRVEPYGISPAQYNVLRILRSSGGEGLPCGEISRRLGMRSCEIRSRAWLAWHLAAGGHFDAAITTVRSAVRDAPGDVVAERDARAVLEFVERTARERGENLPRGEEEESGSWQKSS